MKYEIRLAGTGGQGIILASVILGQAASIYEGKHVIQTQVYGPEARGGATKSDVIISDEPIMYPKAKNVDFLLSLSQKSGVKFVKTVKKGGIVLADSDFVHIPQSDDYKLISLPLIETTLKKQGKLIAVNIVSLAVIQKITNIVKFESLKNSVLDNVPKGTEEFNLEALEIGSQLFLDYKDRIFS